jgi:hypothetical protein
MLKSNSGIRLGSIPCPTIRKVLGSMQITSVKKFFHLLDNAVRYGEKVRTIGVSAKESFEELHVICEGRCRYSSDAKKRYSNASFPECRARHAVRGICRCGISIGKPGTYGSGARFELQVPRSIPFRSPIKKRPPNPRI